MPILAPALCLASGYFLLALTWPPRKMSPAEILIQIALSAGFGLGIFSIVFFFECLLGSSHLVMTDVLVLVLLIVLYVLRRRGLAGVSTTRPEIEDFRAPIWVRSILTVTFAIALVAAVYNVLLRVIAHPHGDGWDALSIWNLHARFLFRGGAHWHDGFNALIPWSHPDYPLLLSATIAHFWSYLGNDAAIVPAIIGIVFALSTVVLLVSALAQLRGRTAALLAGCALLSTPFFVEQATSQYSDVPLSFFILASTVLLCLADFRRCVGENRTAPLVLAGLTAGFAAWTKNEGLLFLLALVVSQLWALTVRQSRKAGSAESLERRRVLAAFLAGAAPVLAVIMYFKHFVAPAGDLFSGPEIMIHKLFTPTRYWVTIRWYAKEFLRFGDWWLVPGTVTMIAFYLLTRRKTTRSPDPFLQASFLGCALTLAGYFAIYLITPQDLYWHLRFSLNRLFLQLWPASLFLFFRFVGRAQDLVSTAESRSKN